MGGTNKIKSKTMENEGSPFYIGSPTSLRGDLSDWKEGKEGACEVWVQSLAASGESMSKGVEARLSSAHSRDSKKAPVIYSVWSKRREEKVGGR